MPTQAEGNGVLVTSYSAVLTLFLSYQSFVGILRFPMCKCFVVVLVHSSCLSACFIKKGRKGIECWGSGEGVRGD